MITVALLGLLGPVIMIGNEGIWVGLILAFGGGVLAWNPIPLVADLLEPFNCLRKVRDWLRTPNSKSLVQLLRIVGAFLFILGLYIFAMKGLTRHIETHISWSS